MLTEHRDMLSPSQCGALPSLPCPDPGLPPSFLAPPAPFWDKAGRCASLYRVIHEYARARHLQKTAKLLRERSSKEPRLPADPRHWSREDVALWIQYTMSSNQLPSVHLDRFLMNGKALCLMSMDMFVSRVPLGGKLLYKDFQLRLSRAMYS